MKAREVASILSQSLFYWNPFCNSYLDDACRRGDCVAILILLESFLQSKRMVFNMLLDLVAILILLESFLQ